MLDLMLVPTQPKDGRLCHFHLPRQGSNYETQAAYAVLFQFRFLQLSEYYSLRIRVAVFAVLCYVNTSIFCSPREG